LLKAIAIAAISRNPVTPSATMMSGCWTSPASIDAREPHGCSATGDRNFDQPVQLRQNVKVIAAQRLF
jgi:hypothetical protein